MFLKKMTYCGAGFACGILIFVIVFFVGNDYSFYTNGPERRISLEIHNNLIQFYLACQAYWKDTNPANACNVDIASRTTYGYIQSRHVVIWGRGGNQYDFNLKGKSPKADGVYSLENKTIKADSKEDQWALGIRRLEDEELESALAEMNTQTDPEKAR